MIKKNVFAISVNEDEDYAKWIERRGTSRKEWHGNECENENDGYLEL